MINEKLLKEYGALEINPLPSKNYHDEEYETISWGELKSTNNITTERIRFVSNSGYPF